MNGSTARRHGTVLLMIVFGACARSGSDAADSAVASTGTRTDTAMGSMMRDSVGPTAITEVAPRDSNQAFLRMMVDHHQGLVKMVTDAQPRLQGDTPKTDAQHLLTAQRTEQQQMRRMLASSYSDQHPPMLLPSNRAMNDSLQITKPGPTYDADFYHHLVAHHREGVQMIDRMLPHLTGDVKAMAQTSRAEQSREILDFERKGGGSGPRG